MALSQTAPQVAEANVPELGLRRVRWVEITISDDGVRAQVSGLAHRLPITRPVTIGVANRLIRAGFPYVVRRSDRSGS